MGKGSIQLRTGRHLHPDLPRHKRIHNRTFKICDSAPKILSNRKKHQASLSSMLEHLWYKPDGISRHREYVLLHDCRPRIPTLPDSQEGAETAKLVRRAVPENQTAKKAILKCRLYSKKNCRLWMIIQEKGAEKVANSLGAKNSAIFMKTGLMADREPLGKLIQRAFFFLHRSWSAKHTTRKELCCYMHSCPFSHRWRRSGAGDGLLIGAGFDNWMLEID